MTTVFRVDSGAHIGSGHAMRCAALADGIVARGGKVLFICKNHLHSQNVFLRERFPLVEISGGVQKPIISHVDDYVAWLGETWEQDLAKTNDCLERIAGSKVVVIDHYSLDENFERGLQCDKVFVIDEILNRKHDCDFLLDQNFNFPLERHQSLCPPKTQFFLGPRFALLRSTFAENRPSVITPIKRVNKILTFMGGTDKTHESLKILEAFLDSSLEAEMHIVLHRSNSDYLKLESMAKKSQRVHLYSQMKNYDQFLLEMDLFLGAAGSSTWERACLGLASFVVIAADNQNDLGMYLHKENIAYLVGHGSQTTEKDWMKIFRETIFDLKLIENLRTKSFEYCDGRGVQRVLDNSLA